LLSAGVSNAINTNFFSDLSFHFLKDIAFIRVPSPNH